jgi:hypothetical protein
MANDLMRTGPRGSSAQEASVGSLQQFVMKETLTNLTTIVKAGADREAWPEQGYFNTVWRIVAVELRVIVTIVNDCPINIGTHTVNNAYVNGYVLPDTTAKGVTINVPLNGTNILLPFGSTPLENLELNQVNDAGGGAYQVTVFAEPTAGRFYST